ncbi:MAG TPA: fatty acid desaturase [Acidimicrobiales bacterium]|nr:fatty acid desaturase [Acidimicrobiales bacterium]
MDRLTAHATHFADGGIAALMFDYRNFGQSEGESRHLVRPRGSAGRLWWMPGKLSGLVVMTTFQWLPHHPHTETDRFRNTRINMFTLSTPTLLEQDHHLMHHLFPRVPWYRYRRLFTEMRPLLQKNSARIEGRRLGADVPKIALR